MIIYYIFAFILILGLTALHIFNFSLKWSVARKSNMDLSKKKKLFILFTAIAVSIIILALYFVVLYLIRRFIFIGDNAVSINDKEYYISLVISLIVLTFIATCLVMQYLASIGIIKLPKNGGALSSVEQEHKTTRNIIRIFAICIAISLVISIMGNATYFKYDNDAIYYSSFFQISETKIDYLDVENVRITYKLSGDVSVSYSYSYELHFKSGKSFSFGLYSDNLQSLNQNLVSNDIRFNFEAEHCKTEYNKIFNSD